MAARNLVDAQTSCLPREIRGNPAQLLGWGVWQEIFGFTPT
jgi:hypothetical protein